MLGIIIVNYKTDDQIIKYVTEELPKISADNKIVIVNNAAVEQSNLKIAEGCRGCVVSDPDAIDPQSQIFVLGIAENLGFAKGNNAGVEFLLRHFQLDYLLISNCDLHFIDSNVVDRLIEKMDNTPDIGLIGPCFVTSSGDRGSPVTDLFVWKNEILPNLLYPLFGFLKSMGKTPCSRIGEDVEGYCDLLNGSFFLARASAFLKAGMFDPNTFIYCEEPILAARIIKSGFRVYYYNKVKVIHEHCITERTLGIYDVTTKHCYNSNRYYQKEYRKINRFELMMFDLSYFIFWYVWKPLFVGHAISKLIKWINRCILNFKGNRPEHQ